METKRVKELQPGDIFVFNGFQKVVLKIINQRLIFQSCVKRKRNKSQWFEGHKDSIAAQSNQIVEYKGRKAA